MTDLEVHRAQFHPVNFTSQSCSDYDCVCKKPELWPVCDDFKEWHNWEGHTSRYCAECGWNKEAHKIQELISRG